MSACSDDDDAASLLDASVGAATVDAASADGAAPPDAGDAGATARRPNILLIVADDLGYSDLGAFGSEIATPNLDALAADGRLLTDHHTGATCSPTRAMLLSGTDHHLVGLGTMAEAIRPEQQGKPGYEGYLNKRALAFPELLRDAGYHTYIAGKWHLGLADDQSPKQWGFEKSYVLLAGVSTHFAELSSPPTLAQTQAYREDGAYVTPPADFFSSDFYTDKLLQYLESQKDDGKPFFAFAAYTAPHWPLQAPEAFRDRYAGRYDEGYDAIRQRRLEKQKALGIVPTDFEPNPLLPASAAQPTWSQLTPEQKKLEARRMELYAAMVENLDHNVGRIVAELKQSGRYDDTFIFFQSDNGAEGEARDRATADNTLPNLGKPGSYIGQGARWAEVSATPFRLWKQYATEGGVSAPAIAKLPRKARGEKLTSLTHVTDLSPTFLELAGVTNPGSAYKGREVAPITGSSLLPALDGRTPAAHNPGDALVDELFGHRYVIRDDWKLLWLDPPYGSSRWSLYNRRTDRGEIHDLSATEPGVVSELTGAWDRYARASGVVLPQPVRPAP